MTAAAVSRAKGGVGWPDLPAVAIRGNVGDREIETGFAAAQVDADPSSNRRAFSDRALPQKRNTTGSPGLSLPANSPASSESSIAGIVLPIKRAEELLGTLPGVVSARIVAGPSGAVDEIHLLTSDEVGPKQTVRNVESALLAHLGMRVSHKKISVATTTEPSMRKSAELPVPTIGIVPQKSAPAHAPAPAPAPAPHAVTPPAQLEDQGRRRLLFEDVEVKRSRTRGVAVKVTLRKGDETLVGEAEGMENERQRIELAARAALAAMTHAEGETRSLALEGCRHIDAFDRHFVFVGVTARVGRDTALLTGSAEVKESAEQSAVLAVLAATNRWVEYPK